MKWGRLTVLDGWILILLNNLLRMVIWRCMVDRKKNSIFLILIIILEEV